MPELLLELGCEELPASFVKKAYTQLESEICARLNAAFIEYQGSHSTGTPRRLIVHISGLTTRQPDSEKRQRGPSLKAAYNNEGQPTAALLGFCKSQAVELSELEKEGDYVWFTKQIKGKTTQKVLSEILPESILSLNFDKSMRWAHTRIRFARPIRWILASYGGDGMDYQAVPFQVESVLSGLESRGHRFEFEADAAGKHFTASSYIELKEELHKLHVEINPDIREKKIRSEIQSVSKGFAQVDEDLITENVFLTEWPTVHLGSFKKEYLALPDVVLTTVMAKHQRFFPVTDAQGSLTNQFLAVRNGGDEATVRAGNEWVLNSRFNDAMFFYQEDQKYNLDHFLKMTEDITFHDKLGSIRQRAYRIEQLCKEIAQADGACANEIEQARLAGKYCKADQSTGLVSELASLQGAIGEEYSLREDFAKEVSQAIGAHYSIDKVLKSNNKIAVYLLIADQIDKLTGYLGLNLVPTGSSDPFGLRRAATYLILANQKLSNEFKGYSSLFEKAFTLYDSVELSIEKLNYHLESLFLSRYQALVKFEQDGAAFQDSTTKPTSPGLLEATFSQISSELLLDPNYIKFRANIVRETAIDLSNKGFIEAATRTINIVQSSEKKQLFIPSVIEKLDSHKAEHLLKVFEAVFPSATQFMSTKNVSESLKQLKLLEKPIHDFFETTMVMVDDEKIRSSRLALLKKCSDLFLQFGNFSVLSV